MNENVPSVTVVIAARPGQVDIAAVSASHLLDYPANKLEIIVARGRQPSAQRNTAVRAAHGELIYFLDDDSVPQRDNLLQAVTRFARPEVKMLGGPNLCPADAPELEQIFALVLSSRVAFGPSRARYAAVGQLRETSEKELILCNLMARRDAMLELGGFNEALYPNEENALMDELQKRGGKLYYDPEFIVHRRPRASLKSFARMLLTYGRGRAEQFRLHPTSGSILNFAPPLFVVYLVCLGGAWIFLPARSAALCSTPLALYALALLGQAVALMPGRAFPARSGTPEMPPATAGFLRRGLRCLAAIPLMTLTHLLYGLGFWRGLFTPLKAPNERPTVPVNLETVTR